ncbi:unnamed protein product, partial [Oppiella nova]
PSRVDELLVANDALLYKPKTLMRHMNDKCLADDCHHIPTDKTSFVEHMRSVHKSTHLYECHYSTCDVIFMSFDGVKQHITRIHLRKRLKPLKCEFIGCGKVLGCLSSFAKHQRVHEVSKLTGCGKVMSSRCSYTQHLLTHSITKPFKCTVDGCDERFTNKANLNCHVNRHNGLKPYACTHESCGQRFAQKKALKYHVQVVHAKHMPFVCDYMGCHKRFAFNYLMTAHKQIHN